MSARAAVTPGFWSLLRDPVGGEKRRLLAERWAALDPDLRLPGQGLGQQATGCGATLGVQPRCDFSCTGCYLGGEANAIPPLPLAAVLAQLDALRAHLGPKSNVQITDGEVTLRPLPELVAILRHARAIGVVPMVMTHGDSFRRHPGLLEELMVEGGLTEVAIHVDITQRGRLGQRRPPRDERELMPLRDELAAVVREARRRTGRPLRAATTMTVTGDNLGGVADVVRWCVANRDAFGLVSFQPLAQVGRTRRGLEGVAPGALWAEVGSATADFGLALSRAPLHFGHPECTRIVPLLAIQRRGERSPRLLQVVRDEASDGALLEELFARGLGGAAFRDDHWPAKLARGAGLLRRAPRWLAGDVRRWAAARLRAEAGTGPWRLLAAVLIGRARVDALTLTSHHFMDADELATPTGRARLAACVFRVPHEGRLAPMCEVNAGGLRARAYAQQQRDAAST
ncbi:MAG TPA: radical SAM protein [Thermoanaerobaculia bacterium]|nr:radical SAM protein [Thermoanaerobaculia bacterium]